MIDDPLREGLFQLLSDIRAHEREDRSQFADAQRQIDSVRREVATERRLSDDRLETVMKRFDEFELNMKEEWRKLAMNILSTLAKENLNGNGSGGGHEHGP